MHVLRSEGGRAGTSLEDTVVSSIVTCPSQFYHPTRCGVAVTAIGSRWGCVLEVVRGWAGVGWRWVVFSKGLVRGWTGLGRGWARVGYERAGWV